MAFLLLFVVCSCIAVRSIAEDLDVRLVADDECDAEHDSDCALSALQKNVMRTHEASQRAGIWHYALPCWSSCQKAGFCEDYCGPGNACCRHNELSDPTECHNVRFWPVMGFYTCVATGITVTKPDANKVVAEGSSGTSQPSELIFAGTPSLLQPSDASVLTYYVYRVQSEEEYNPENQDMGNIGGILWYLHNEIVWHPRLKRSGTYFSTPKTRIERFKVSTKATQPLYEMGMNFGPVNAFDLTRCTGPYNCENFKRVGYAVGCEDWRGGEASFPHQQWVGQNLYPGAQWYSLPGPCSSLGMGHKTASCMMSEPGGACRNTTVPTGTGDCTYVYEKVGEISIDELEGITNPGHFKAMGYYEYNRWIDRGHGTDFWNHKMSIEANQKRIDRALELFRTKYPDQEDLPDPTCNFDKGKFYSKRR